MESCSRDSSAFFTSDLFRDVQMTRLFGDSKSFADAVAKKSMTSILASYHRLKPLSNYELKYFINEHFELPSQNEIVAEYTAGNVYQHIELLWESLLRRGNEKPQGSLIPLFYPYIVPGGRFREIYYWDSYFTSLGLVAANKTEIAEGMLNNLVALQEQLGVIPNGNRSYYCTRSQPPVLALMVHLLQPIKKNRKAFIKRYISAIENEYQFWMKGADKLTLQSNTCERTVMMPNGSILNRYWDTEATPRPESYFEDVELANSIPENERSAFYRNIRAACESGWDFSSRWLEDPQELMSIQTTDLIPVDLNSLLYLTERYLSEFHHFLGDEDKTLLYGIRAMQRKKAINNYLWCSKQSFYFDYHFPSQKLTEVKSLAAAVPLFAKLASEQQAKACRDAIETGFLKEGGLVTTTIDSIQQWDSPNGWAPLHWFTVIGLRNYQYDHLASKIASRWLSTVEVYFEKTGKLMEKYNVCQQEEIAQGGEYDVQEGFGWTNGVTLALSRQI